MRHFTNVKPSAPGSVRASLTSSPHTIETLRAATKSSASALAAEDMVVHTSPPASAGIVGWTASRPYTPDTETPGRDFAHRSNINDVDLDAAATLASLFAGKSQGYGRQGGEMPPTPSPSPDPAGTQRVAWFSNTVEGGAAELVTRTTFASAYRIEDSRHNHRTIALTPSPARHCSLSGSGVPLPLHVTTFQTRSRSETRALQAEAQSQCRRYIPPPREQLQSLQCQINPPSSPLAVEAIDKYPIVRIGDTVEIKFNLATPFQELCAGYEIEPHDQVALGFGCNIGGGESRIIAFEIMYHSFSDGTVCLRCQKSVPEPTSTTATSCTCTYPNDLLEINRDWKAKKDPSRRLGLRSYGDGGTIGLALRIPRTRRPLSAAEKAAGCGPNYRPNTWNSMLRQRGPKDAKVVLIRVTEYACVGEGDAKKQTVLTMHQGYARLIAKNGGQVHGTSKSRAKRKQPTRTDHDTLLELMNARDIAKTDDPAHKS